MTERINTDQLTSLAEKAAAYRRGGNHLLKALEQIEQLLDDMFGSYTQFRFTHESIAFVGNLKSSNVGEYGCALGYVVNYHGGGEQIKPMPPTWSRAGGGYYLHNDFNCSIDYATRSEIARLAKGLPAFLEALAKFLSEKAAQNEETADKLERIADAITSALEVDARRLAEGEARRLERVEQIACINAETMVRDMEDAEEEAKAQAKRR